MAEVPGKNWEGWCVRQGCGEAGGRCKREEITAARVSAGTGQARGGWVSSKTKHRKETRKEDAKFRDSLRWLHLLNIYCPSFLEFRVQNQELNYTNPKEQRHRGK